MATVTVKGDLSRIWKFELDFCAGQASDFFFEQDIAMDTGYTLEVFDLSGTLIKTLTVGSGLTLSQPTTTSWRMEIFFGNDLLSQDYRFTLKADNQVAPFDVKYIGKLNSV